MSGSMHLQPGRQNGATVDTSLAARGRSRDRLRLLAEAIEAEIVPRLVAGYDGFTEPAPAATYPRLWDGGGARLTGANDSTPAQDAARDLAFGATPQAAIDLAGLVLRDGDIDVTAHVAASVAARGLESVCLDLLAPAARHLGDLWCEDIVSFTDVTIGLMRLQSALLAITTPPAGTDSGADPRHTILLAPVPGEQHTFGLTMVAGFFERAEWQVTHLQECAVESLLAALRANWFGIVGLSAGSTVKLSSLCDLLPRLRAVSRNPDLAIMLGGPAFLERPELARSLGADMTAANGPHAVQVAEDLVAPRKFARTATG